MRTRRTGGGTFSLLLAAAAAGAGGAAGWARGDAGGDAGGAASLYAPGRGFADGDRIVSTTVFHWYSPTPHQYRGPWRPLEGLAAWDGGTEWWKTQVKQTMAANVDVLYVHLIDSFEPQRVNLFRALGELRSEGYRVPKVAPFLDPAIRWSGSKPRPDLATAAGKDAFVGEYARFYQQYFSVNTDAHADQYLHQVNGRPVLDIWYGLETRDNVSSLTRADIETRLAGTFGAQHPSFNNGIYMVVPSTTPLTFYDESIFQYELPDYFLSKSIPGITTAQVKPGYWDENIRTPGKQWKRDGGIHYRDAWTQTNAAARADATMRRVNVESFNEYDEGSGIYAADPGPPYIRPGTAAAANGSTDDWSLTDDPYEYIRTSAAGAALFNETPWRDAQVVWHDLPGQLGPGETRTVTVVVRNEGDLGWRGADGYAFGQRPEGAGGFPFAPPAVVDDAAHEIPAYGGVFRGRPMTLQFQVTAPAEPGAHETRWSMRRTTRVSDYGNSAAFNWHLNRPGARPNEQAPGLVEAISTSALYDDKQDPAAALGGVGGVEPDSLIFADAGTPDNGNAVLGDGGERVDFVRFQTAVPVQIAGYRVHVIPDGWLTGGNRGAELVGFSVGGQMLDLFDNNGAAGTVDRLLAGGPVVGDDFTLFLTRTRSTGPRLIEIDAILGPDNVVPITRWFGEELNWTFTVVPEPTPLLPAAAAVAALTLRRRRERPCSGNGGRGV